MGDRREWIARAIVVGIAVLAFGGAVPFPLMRSWDDARFLIDFAPIHEVSWNSFWTIVSEPHFEAYHPLHLLSYWIDVPWVGPSGAAVHAVNLALWCLSLIAVHTCMRELGLGLVPATLATLLLGLHPVQVEAVVWATGRKEILALGLGASSFLVYLRSSGEHPSPLGVWVSRALYLLAILAKTSVLPLPLVLIAADVWLRGKPWREACKAQIPSGLIAVAMGASVVSIWSGNEMIRSSSEPDALLVPATFVHYLRTALWPSQLSPLYPLAREQPLSASAAALGTLCIAAIIGVAWMRREHLLARRALFGMTTWIVLTIPVSNVLPLYFQWADRYLSLPLLGLAFVAGALLEAAARSRLALAIAGSLVVALAARTLQYERVWRSDAELWHHAVFTQPRSFYAWIKLGEVRRDEGRLDASIRAYRRAIEIAPQIRLAHAALLGALMRREEMRTPISPSRASGTSERFMVHMDDDAALRDLASELAEAGYRESMTYVLGRAFQISRPNDDTLEHAAEVQLGRGNVWLATFYVRQMSRPALRPVLRQLIADDEAERPTRP